MVEFEKSRYFKKTKHVRQFGREKYVRVTDELPLRRAKVLSMELRSKGAWKARIDKFRDGYAIFGKRVPIKEQLKERKTKTGRISAGTQNWELAQDYIVKLLEKGYGIDVLVSKSRSGFLYSIRAWKMKKIPRPKLKLKKSVRGALTKSKMRKLVLASGGDGVFIYGFDSKVLVRRNPFSNRVWSAEFNGSITLNPEEKKVDSKWIVTGNYDIMYHIGTEVGVNREVVDTPAQAKSAVMDMWHDFSSKAEWYNEQFAKHTISDDLKYVKSEEEFVEFFESDFPSFDDMWEETARDYHHWE